MKNSIILKLIPGVLVALFFCVALYLRIALPYDQVFTGDWVKFISTDAYYHMRIIDNLVHNFPHLNSFDPYMLFPGGAALGTSFLFFDYFVAGLILLLGLGSPSPGMIDTVGVYVPAILGALTVITVYFLGKELFNRWAGVIAAGISALSPGELLGKTMLGYTDHHVLEVMFTCLIMLFLVLAIKSAVRNQFRFCNIKEKRWSAIARPLLYSLIAGFFLGLYLLTWLGALLFVFIIFLYFVIQFIYDHVKGTNTDYLSLIGAVTFTVALLVFAPSAHVKEYVAALIGGLVGIAVMGVLSWLLNGRGLKTVYYPVILFGAGLVVIAIFYIIDPGVVKAMADKFAVITPSGARLTTIEAQPLFFPDGKFTFELAWLNFTTGLFLGVIALGIVIYQVLKSREADKMLLVAWSVVILIAAISMRRFAYYFAINAALLTGYAGWLILSYMGFKKAGDEPEAGKPPVKMTKDQKRRQQKKGSASKPGGLVTAVGIVIVFFLTLFPNIGPAIDTGRGAAALYTPPNPWIESLKWLKSNTPEPLGNADVYYQRYREPFVFPDTAYGVTAWWDYGYLITRIGHRIPSCNPGGGFRVEVARCLTAQDEASAGKILDELRSRYVIVDSENVTGQFYAIAQYAAEREDRYFETYYQKQSGKLKAFTFFYPEYYRSLAVRLYSFDGNRVNSAGASVITYEEKTDSGGKRYKEIVSVQSFPIFEAASSYVATQGKSNCKVVGTDPYVSPVALEKMDHFSLVYSSRDWIKVPQGGNMPAVKIFERLK